MQLITTVSLLYKFNYNPFIGNPIWTRDAKLFAVLFTFWEIVKYKLLRMLCI